VKGAASSGRRPEVDLGPDLLLEPAQRHRLVEGCSPQDRLGGEQCDPTLPECSGHRLRRPRQPHEPPRRARREIQALHHVVLEAPEAELAMEAALQDLAQDPADLEVDALEERNGRAESAVELRTLARVRRRLLRRPRAHELAQASVGVAAAQEDEGGPRRAPHRRHLRLGSRRRHVTTRTQRTSAHRSPPERWGGIRSNARKSRRAV